MANTSARQERLGATVMSLGSVFMAVMKWIDQPAPGEIEEMGPDWYENFSLFLYGALVVFLLLSLLRLPAMTAERPGLRAPFAGLILVGIAAAAYVLAQELGLA